MCVCSRMGHVRREPKTNVHLFDCVCASSREIRSQNASNRQCESSSHFVAIVYFVLRRRRRHKEVLISMKKGQTNKSFASRIRIVEFSRFTLSQCIECRAHCDDKISTYYILFIVPLSLYRLHTVPQAHQHSAMIFHIASRANALFVRCILHSHFHIYVSSLWSTFSVSTCIFCNGNLKRIKLRPPSRNSGVPKTISREIEFLTNSWLNFICFNFFSAHYDLWVGRAHSLFTFHNNTKVHMQMANTEM